MCYTDDARPPYPPVSGGSVASSGDLILESADGTSFMAYAAHQLNVIADFAEPTKPPPVCWLVAPSELVDGIAKQELVRRG